MGNKYHMIKNFTTNGDLGISTKAITEIVTIAISEVDGVVLPISHSFLFRRENVKCRFNAIGDLIIKCSILVKYGNNVEEMCNFLQEKIERVLMFTTEIKPKKIHIKVGNINA